MIQSIPKSILGSEPDFDSIAMSMAAEGPQMALPQPPAPPELRNRDEPVGYLGYATPQIESGLCLPVVHKAMGRGDASNGIDQVQFMQSPAPPTGEENNVAVRVGDSDGSDQGIAGPAPRLGNARPLYPAQALRQRWEGTVRLTVLIGPSGAVTRASYRTRSGHAVLDEAAMSAVRQWRFTPAIRRGIALEFETEQAVCFKLGK